MPRRQPLMSTVHPNPDGRVCGRGFTLIEVLTAVGIIAVLVGISVVAFRFVGDGARGGSVRVTLENLRTASAEAESAGMFRRQPSGMWVQPPAVATVPPFNNGTWNNGVQEFWRKPLDLASSAELPIRSPGLVTEQKSWVTVNPAIRNTAIALAMMQSVPAARKGLEALPDTTVKLPEFWDATRSYTQGTVVIFDHGTGATQGLHVYSAARAVTAGVAPTLNTDSSDWTRDFAGVLDPWRNPIIFVPSAGIHVGREYVTGRTYKQGERVFVVGANRTYYVCIAATTTADPSVTTAWRNVSLAANPQPIRAPDGKPFWMSAGPDGDFDTPQDNVNSFDQ
jgi:prepilin-type N-terminal cleavage/methylation domain-containing protein